MRNNSESGRAEGGFPIKYLSSTHEPSMNWTRERQCASGGVTQVVLVVGNEWRGGDQRCIGDQSADNTNLHDVR